MKKVLLLSLMLVWPACAEIGANAPSIPPTYVATHPRLPHPDAKFLAAVCSNGHAGSSGDHCHMVARYRRAAEDWNSASPGSRIAMRYLLIAYLASKESGKPNLNYLNKIKEFQNLTGNWSLKNGMGYWDPALALALAYDWIYSDLDPATQASIRNSLYTMMSGFEANYEGSSPYNDQFYITGFKQMLHLMAALAIYPDDAPNSLPHLRWSMDVWFNMLVPAWKQVIGGGGLCAASTDASNDCGGGWHEGWEYVNQADGLRAWYVTSLLAWASASGRGIAYFTQNNPWLKNWAYQTMYQVRPDFNLEPIGAVSRPYFTSEYTGASGADLGFLDGLAAIFDDPTLRGWSRLVNWSGATPDGYEPSAWPYYTPDSAAHPANGRAALAPVRDFPGWGTIFFRTGWSENDTFCTLRYGDNYWSHPVQDTGAFTCYNRGGLAIRSGSYRPGSASLHFQEYAAQAIAQNLPLIYDPHDYYDDETVPVFLNSGAQSMAPMRNDGGQRRVGSSMGNFGEMAAVQASPSDPAQWFRNREYFHEGNLIGYAVASNNKYAFAAVDLTAAYNNLWSRNPHTSAWNPRQANTSNRSFRVQKAVRQFVFVPRGTAAYVIIFDQVSSANPIFEKKVLIHSINQPAINSNAYVISRTETVTARPDVNFWPQFWASSLKHCPHGCGKYSTQYQYNGKLYGWMTLPKQGSLKIVGGPGHEFEIKDAKGATNFNQCMRGQCATNEGFGKVTDYINPDPSSAPQQPGSWRIEQTAASNNITDEFLNVMLVTSADDQNAVSAAPVTTVSGTNYITTWKDKNDTCNYTLTLPQVGVGGAITVHGAGCETEIN